MRLRCANCRRPLLTGDKQGTSRVYGTHGACTLCESCVEYENSVIQKKGTNHVPELWAIYVYETGPAAKSEPESEHKTEGSTG